MTEACAAPARVPALAPGHPRRRASVVVVTEYGFDAERWRLAAGPGPRVLAVELGTAGRSEVWRRVPLAPGPSLRLLDDGAPGTTRIVLAGGHGDRSDNFAIGDVELVYRRTHGVARPRRAARSPPKVIALTVRSSDVPVPPTRLVVARCIEKAPDRRKRIR